VIGVEGTIAVSLSSVRNVRTFPRRRRSISGNGILRTTCRNLLKKQEFHFAIRRPTWMISLSLSLTKLRIVSL
jgi:hypothetical protein